jgi:ligand-binding sensor domain-containing protein
MHRIQKGGNMKKLFTWQIVILMLGINLSPKSSQCQWIQTSGPGGGVTEALAVVGNTLVAGTFGGGIYSTSDDNFEWTQRNTGLQNTNVNALAVSDTNLFAGTFGGVYRSINNGITWTSTGLSFNNLVRALAVNGKTLLAGTPAGAYLSDDNSQTWTAINTGLTDLDISAVLVSNTYLFAGTGNGVFRSSRDTVNWTAVNNGLTDTNIQSFFQSGAYLLAGTNSGVFISTDYGNKWNRLYNSLGDGTVQSIVSNGTNLFACSRGNGVFWADTNSKTWVNTSISDSNVFSLAVYNNNLFAGTGNRVWRRPISEIVTGTNDNQRLSPEFVLNQNYPNPFKINTCIEFSLSFSEFVNISVYNVEGRKIATLVNSNKSAGKHTIVLNKADLPAGVYYCQMLSGNKIETRKMIKVN